jgi:lipopolysaccharide/colanic/teichoic acid biosynthesis glycosyltransferase
MPVRASAGRRGLSAPFAAPRCQQAIFSSGREPFPRRLTLKAVGPLSSLSQAPALDLRWVPCCCAQLARSVQSSSPVAGLPSALSHEEERSSTTEHIKRMPISDVTSDLRRLRTNYREGLAAVAQLAPRHAAVGAVSSTAATPPPAPPSDFPRVPLWKRVLDVCCVLIAVPSLLPVLLMIAIVIKIGSKGPVLFKQERVGLLGKRFIIFKFRTMIAGADTAIHEKHADTLIESNRPMTKLDTHGDARLIPFGRMLRAAGLDELPQLINVLRGEMSFVGPRPCLPSEYNKYLPWQRERFDTPPGLTGGFRQEPNDLQRNDQS